MEFSRRNPPVWVMGLSGATLGFINGFASFAMPQLMAAEHVPEAKIVAITAVALSPNFWSVLFGPLLDVRFSRRWYATVLAASSALSAAVAVLSLQHLVALQIAMALSVMTAGLSSSALGGWLSNIIDHKDANALSKWLNIALVSGTGVTSVLGGELVRRLPVLLAATLLGILFFLPAAIFLFIPAPGPDQRLASESFSQFNREVLALLRRRKVVVVLLLFLSPCSSFVLPNLLGGLGNDFHASARAVSLAGGVGAFIPGILGCFLFPYIAVRLPLRLFYLANGILGGLFSLSLIVLPHAPLTYALALFGEFLFQAVAYAIQIAITFDAIGPHNPLAATTFAFLIAATNIPVAYMMIADGHAYAVAGVAGSLTVDASIGIVACLLAGILLTRFGSQKADLSVQGADLVDAVQEEN